jgi:hypothetical protein
MHAEMGQSCGRANYEPSLWHEDERGGIMHQALQAQAPIWTDEGLSFPLINELLGVSNEVTAEIIGVSEGTIRSKQVSHATLRKSQLLIHILNMLWELTDKNPGEVKRWLFEPRIAWGKSPIDLLQTKRSEAVAKYLEGLLDGEVVGS